MAENVNDPDALALTAQIVSAHVAHNSVSPDQLPDLIRNVFAALGKVASPVPEKRTGRSHQTIGARRLHHLFGRRQEVLHAEASSEHRPQDDAAAVSREMGPAA